MCCVQFIELCILLGCDYLEPIKGVGPKSALKLLREHGGLGAVVEHLREKFVPLPFSFLHPLLTLHHRMAAKEDKEEQEAEDGGEAAADG